MRTVTHYQCQSEQLSDEEILERRLFRVIVIGLARSGTSMMSGICERLGIDWLHNTESPESLAVRKKNELRRFGPDYQMNERFYEINDNRLAFLHRFIITPQSGIKMLLPVNKHLADLISCAPVRVIQMWRDPEEIRQSQQASYNGDRIETDKQIQKRLDHYQDSLVGGASFFLEAGVPLLNVKYREVLDDPEGKTRAVAEFINATVSIDEAVEWVDPSRNRFKSECLTQKI